MIDELVSIIIPAYNVENYIYRAIESSCNQTYKNIEIIIVDDGSTDNTWVTIKKYSKSNSKIIAIHQTNQGVSAARNNALKNANGKYCLFLDSDDWLSLDTVEYLMTIAKSYPNALISVTFYEVLEKGNKQTYTQPQGNGNMKFINSTEALATIGEPTYRLWSACYKLYKLHNIKKNNIFFRTDIHHGEDGLFVFQYLHTVDGLYYNYEPKWYILTRANSASHGSYSSKHISVIKSVEAMRTDPNNDKKTQIAINEFCLKRIIRFASNSMNSKTYFKKDWPIYSHYLKNYYHENSFQTVGIKKLLFIILFIFAPRVLMLIKKCYHNYKKHINQ